MYLCAIENFSHFPFLGKTTNTVKRWRCSLCWLSAVLFQLSTYELQCVGSNDFVLSLFLFRGRRKRKGVKTATRNTEKHLLLPEKEKKNYVRLPLKTHSTLCDNIKLINDEIRRRAFLCVGFISTVCGLVWRGDSAISNEICIACRMHYSWAMSESCDKRINLLALYLSRNAATNVFLHNNVKHTDHFVFKTCLFVATKKMNI